MSIFDIHSSLVLDFETQQKGPARAALVRAILNMQPQHLKGFIVCALRYTLTLTEGVVTACSANIPHTEETEGYHDDDYTPVAGFPRLGGTHIMGSPAEKTNLETLLKQWFEYTVLERPDRLDEFLKAQKAALIVDKKAPERPQEFDTLNQALKALLPDMLRMGLTKLSLKVDVYTDRTVLGWHKDWNDGHALLIGLLNVSDSSIGSTELFFDPSTNKPKESEWSRRGTLRPASTSRKKILDLIPSAPQQDFFFKKFEEHEVGEIRWINDVVWIHRTPPLGTYTDGNGNQSPNFYRALNYNNKFFSLGSESADIPPGAILDANDDGATYVNTQLGQGARMLVRLTIRDMYEPCTEAWYHRTMNTAERKMWFRVEGTTATRWRFKGGTVTSWTEIPFTEMSAVVIEQIENESWCSQSCDATRFFIDPSDPYWASRAGHYSVSYEFQYEASGRWKPVPSVSVLREDMMR